MQPLCRRVVYWRGYTGMPAQSCLTTQMQEPWRQSFAQLAGLISLMTMEKRCRTKTCNFCVQILM